MADSILSNFLHHTSVFVHLHDPNNLLEAKLRPHFDQNPQRYAMAL